MQCHDADCALGILYMWLLGGRGHVVMCLNKVPLADGVKVTFKIE